MKFPKFPKFNKYGEPYTYNSKGEYKEVILDQYDGIKEIK